MSVSFARLQALLAAAILVLAAAMPAPAAAADTFRHRDETLRVDSSSLDVDENDNMVTFRAIWNFDSMQSDGFLSIRATIVIDCDDETYTMPQATYYDGPFGSGDIIDTDDDEDSPESIHSDRVIAKAAQAYCE